MRYLSVSHEIGMETRTEATNGGATRRLERAPLNPKVWRIIGLESNKVRTGLMTQ